jgi:hypothetical protein
LGQRCHGLFPAVHHASNPQSLKAESDCLPDILHQPSGAETPLPDPSACPKKISLITFGTYLVYSSHTNLRRPPIVWAERRKIKEIIILFST